jgi:hypothetical protein
MSEKQGLCKCGRIASIDVGGRLVGHGGTKGPRCGWSGTTNWSPVEQKPEKNGKTLADVFFGEGAADKLKAKQVELEIAHRKRERQHAWEMFAAAASAHALPNRAAEYADELLVEWEKRFADTQPSPEEAAEAIVNEILPR